MYLTSKQKDEIKNLFYSKIHSIKPHIIPDDFVINFIPVSDNDMIIKNLHVIEIKIPQPYDNTIIYITSDRKLFIKLDGIRQEFDISEMQTIVKKRMIELFKIM